jgi:prepilin-type N-terminal cleavage/methylation domain-containing protein
MLGDRAKSHRGHGLQGLTDGPFSNFKRRSLERSGFTLIELLVVIVIISVLAGLLVPTLAAARDQGRRAACISNLRQLHVAYGLYAEDHSGRIPPFQNAIGFMVPRPDGVHVPLPEHGGSLVQSLDPYTRSRDIWFCPSDPLARTVSTAGSIRRQFTSYQVGGVVMARLPFEPITMLGPAARDTGEFHPSDQALLMDCTWPAAEHIPQHPGYTHGSGVNTLCFDGNVRLFRRSGL